MAHKTFPPRTPPRPQPHVPFGPQPHALARTPQRALAQGAAALAVLLASALASTAQADAKLATPRPLPLYQQECAACHVAYPPGLLPAASWQRVVAGLSMHYGTDASIDEAARRAIGAWLAANAGTYKRAGEEPPQDRITRSAWFLREHRAGELPAGVWKRASVGSPSNCAACHTGAAQGDFSERNIRIPQ